MQARQTFGLSFVRLAAITLAWLAIGFASTAVAQQRANTIAADLVAEGPPVAGETLTVALRFRPQEGWHGYWSNPGDAGLGMTLDWDLPSGWQAGEPRYPVPEVLNLFGIVNHAYERDYTVLIPLEVPAAAAPSKSPSISVEARWLSCSDELCVPEQAMLALRFPQASPALRSRFDSDRAAIPPLLDRRASFAFEDDKVFIAIPVTEDVRVSDPHVFVERSNVVEYAAPQTFIRTGNTLIAELARSKRWQEPDQISGIIALDDGQGLRFEAVPGAIPEGGTPVGGALAQQSFALLLGGALLGGLLLNLMPCVFPILSLKALTLARAGGGEGQARKEGLAYTAGTLLACLALGAVMLLLRGAGEQIGWAFQLQQPLVVGALLILGILITANLAGFYEIPSLPIRSRGQGGAFATGLLAAVVATPCTGPFMAAALGAALLLPPTQALFLFAAMGLGLALPFLLLGYVPKLRIHLPAPGPWMETFRRVMAVPMGLTTLAIVWLAWRIGGGHFAFAAIAAGVLLIVALVAWQRASVLVAAIAVIGAIYFTASLPFRVEARVDSSVSILEPAAYTEGALEEARSSGAPVFLWFTADWCVTCKVNESVAIERETTRAAFEDAGVIAMRGDWTRANPEITRYLEAQGAAGVPLYIWYPAGGGDALQLPQVLTPDLLVNLAQ